MLLILEFSHAVFVKNKTTQINTIFGPGLESYFLSNIFVDKNKSQIKSPKHAGCEYRQNLQQMTKLLEAWNLEDLFLMVLDFKLHLRIPRECLSVNIYLLNVNNRNPSKRCNMLTKPTIKAAKRRHLLLSGVSLLLILNIVLTFFVVFLLLILKK